MAKVGDIVRFLNSVGGGRIIRIVNDMAYVDDDGFETPVLLKECVVVSAGPQNRGFYEAASLAPKGKEADKKEQPAPMPAPTPVPDEPPFEETEEGEMLNIVLGYEAEDLKKLSQTKYYAYLVNDSNYYLFITYLTRGDEQDGWTTRFAGVIEPGMEVLIDKIERDDLPNMDRIAVQYVAYKLGKEFNLKTVACVENKLDTTKFYKLHCFQFNPYFDDPVISFWITRNDLPARQIAIDPASLEKAMHEKANIDKKGKPMKKEAKHAPDEPIVVDLHIQELVDSTAGLSNSDMINLQIDTFRKVMDANLKRHGQKIIFIHGKGEGVLRQAILKELNYRYKGHDVQDASFREYGFGATQVRIK